MNRTKCHYNSNFPNDTLIARWPRCAVKALVYAMLSLLTTACWNGENHVVQFGDVSIGQQLIDLQAARDAGAMTDTEYAEVKAKLISLADMCNANDDNSNQRD
jgi:hypothetical protein